MHRAVDDSNRVSVGAVVFGRAGGVDASTVDSGVVEVTVHKLGGAGPVAWSVRGGQDRLILSCS